jgi:hypothetical protein
MISNPSPILVGPSTCISSRPHKSFQEKPQKHFAHGTGPGTHLKSPRHPGREFAGVCEARPGIIESTHIAPLDDNLSIGLELKLYRFVALTLLEEGRSTTPGMRTPRDDQVQ